MSDSLFVFDEYKVTAEGKKVSFFYHYKNSADETIGSFEEYYILPTAINPTNATTRYILQQLHIIIGINYYKSLLGQIQLPYDLTQSEVDYYNTIYHDGLGEYSFVNQLTGIIKPFSVSAEAEDRQPIDLPANAGALLGVGGGKDSTVAAEITKGIQLETTVLDIATRDHHGQAGAVMDKTGLPQMRVERYLDYGIVAFTAEHQGKNGHVPLSVFLSWIGVLLAYTTNKRYIMMANEAATAEGFVEWNGRVVNHQWAKSPEVEKLTQNFVHTHVSPDLWYFSPIRAYSSLAVMELFAIVGTPYYQDFTSCNAVLRIDPSQRPNGRWCTHCAKCLSTWLLLSTKITVPQLTEIFGRNLFDDTTLRPTLDALLGITGHKPLDCVGTIEELRAATRLTLENSKNHPLLNGLSVTDIPGPSSHELINTRAKTTVPPELQDPIEDFVSLHLKQ
jgi:hypothetical protein